MHEARGYSQKTLEAAAAAARRLGKLPKAALTSLIADGVAYDGTTSILQYRLYTKVTSAANDVQRQCEKSRHWCAAANFRSHELR